MAKKNDMNREAIAAAWCKATELLERLCEEIREGDTDYTDEDIDLWWKRVQRDLRRPNAAARLENEGPLFFKLPPPLAVTRGRTGADMDIAMLADLDEPG